MNNEEGTKMQTNNNQMKSAQPLQPNNHTTIGCPLTTEIFARISANAADELKLQGATEFRPYWRTLKTGGLLNEKYSGGLKTQKKLSEQEGHVLIQKARNVL